MPDQPDLFDEGANGSEPSGPDTLRDLIDDNFVQYASYVIRDRAIPDLADGLKPVQRRILHALHETDDGKFTKVANIVGHTMQYHPHGDASIADALVALVNKRYLIEGQGNFGNVLTGDPPAASRYIECRLTALAREEIFHPELTPYVPNYDGRRREPVHLPAKLPLLLMLGADGIAVGLSTRILPHNFGELLEAQIAILQKKPFDVLPDFEQGGLMDATGYEGGNGRIRLRARVETAGDDALVIREIPYGTTTDSVMASIEDAARKKKLSIQSIDDFTAAEVEIRIKLGADSTPRKTIEKLYAFTQCEVGLSSRLVVIRDNQPVELTVPEVLKLTTRRLLYLLRRELELLRRNLTEEIHRKTLAQLFVEHRVYKKIEEQKTYEAVQKAVRVGMERFRKRLQRDITAKDIEMLLGIPIKRISKFDIEKSRKDIGGLVQELERVEKDLSDVKAYAIRYLRGLLRKYGSHYPRKSELTTFKEVAVRELTARELSICIDPEKGYLGHDVKGEVLFECSSHDKVLLVRNDGQYRVTAPPDKVYVGEEHLHAAVADRKRVYTMVYTHEQTTYLKRFAFGGAILNKEYLCTPEGASILFFSDQDPETLYVKYKKEKRQRIHQQVFHPRKQAVKGVKAKGSQMTVKSIRWIDSRKPRNWSRGGDHPAGAVMDFV